MYVLYVVNKNIGCARHTYLVWCHSCLVTLCCKVEERCLESWGTMSPSPENPFFTKSTFPEILHLIWNRLFYKRGKNQFDLAVCSFFRVKNQLSEWESYSVSTFNYLINLGGIKRLRDESLNSSLPEYALTDVIFGASFIFVKIRIWGMRGGNNKVPQPELNFCLSLSLIAWRIYNISNVRFLTTYSFVFSTKMC